MSHAERLLEILHKEEVRVARHEPIRQTVRESARLIEESEATIDAPKKALERTFPTK